MLIVRDLITHGTRTYSDFKESPEHIATNILACRLKLLTALEIIERTDPEGAARDNAARLAQGAEALPPVLKELGKWSHSHLKPRHPDIVSITSVPR